jgi:hypothetical protein
MVVVAVARVTATATYRFNTNPHPFLNPFILFFMVVNPFPVRRY